MTNVDVLTYLAGILGGAFLAFFVFGWEAEASVFFGGWGGLAIAAIIKKLVKAKFDEELEKRVAERRRVDE